MVLGSARPEQGREGQAVLASGARHRARIGVDRRRTHGLVVKTCDATHGEIPGLLCWDGKGHHARVLLRAVRCRIRSGPPGSRGGRSRRHPAGLDADREPTRTRGARHHVCADRSEARGPGTHEGRGMSERAVHRVSADGTGRDGISAVAVIRRHSRRAMPQRATRSSHGVPTTRNTTRQKRVVSAPSLYSSPCVR